MATMQQRQDGAFIDTPHDDDCPHPWWWMTGKVEWRNKVGAVKASEAVMAGVTTRWHVAECNSAGTCPALALVREDAIVGLIPGDNR